MRRASGAIDRSAQCALSPKNVLKWGKRTTTVNVPVEPKSRSAIAQRSPRGSIGDAGVKLIKAHEIISVAFRRRTLLSLNDVRRSSWNDVVDGSRNAILKLTHSALRRHRVGHGTPRPPQDKDASPKRQTITGTTLGYVYIDSAELRTAGGIVHVILAIDCVSEFGCVLFFPRDGHRCPAFSSCAALSGSSLPDPQRADRRPRLVHIDLSPKCDTMRPLVDRVCERHRNEHARTMPYRPWTIGLAGRMNRTVKKFITEAAYYKTSQALRP